MAFEPPQYPAHAISLQAGPELGSPAATGGPLPAEVKARGLSASLSAEAVRGSAELFESVYTNAEDDSDRVPWTVGHANPQLVAWLNRDACCAVRPGARAVVVGCGLGDDVVELFRRGYDVVGFDVSPTAVKWASRRHPSVADRLVHADLLDPPGRFLSRFDLVIEINTLAALEPSLQGQAARGVARLLSPRGVALVMCRAKVPEEAADPLSYADGPPFALDASEMRGLFTECGLACRGEIETFWDTGETPRAHLKGLFVRE